MSEHDDLVRRLRLTPLYYGSGEDADMGEHAADAIEAQQATIETLKAALHVTTSREAAIRADERAKVIAEAKQIAEDMSSGWWGEYKDRLSPNCADPHYQGMSDGASDVANALDALHTDASRAAADMGIPISEPAQTEKGGAL